VDAEERVRIAESVSDQLGVLEKNDFHARTK
jgi:hypothetical protein